MVSHRTNNNHAGVADERSLEEVSDRMFENAKKKLRYAKLLIKENLILEQLISVVCLFFAILIAKRLMFPKISFELVLFSAAVYSLGLGVGFLLGDIVRKKPLRIKRPEIEIASD